MSNLSITPASVKLTVPHISKAEKEHRDRVLDMNRKLIAALLWRMLNHPAAEFRAYLLSRTVQDRMFYLSLAEMCEGKNKTVNARLIELKRTLQETIERGR